MTIIKCGKCGELIHKADKCFMCGNTADFTETNSSLSIHENVKEKYEDLERLIENGKYDEALAISKLVLEWMPSCSDVFWLRLLAKNRCNTDEELIRKGVSCEDSAEYYNAVIYASETQKKVYLNVAAKIVIVKKILTQYITENEYEEKNNTDIIQVQSDLPCEIEVRRKKMFQLWDELKQTESQMVTIEQDCLLLVNEHKYALDKTKTDANLVKNKAYKMEECSNDELHKYQIQFDSLLYQSEQAKSSIDTMKKRHSCIETYSNLIKKRDDIVSQISGEINSLKNYESQIQSTVSEIEKIEARHTAALIEVTKYNFSEIRKLLGEKRFVSAFVEAGIR